MTGLDVVNRALTGGNQFDAIQDYLTSREFQENRPDMLIWENPIYNSLTRFGDQPMRELIAAARGDCKIILAANHASEIQLDLPPTTNSRDTILVDYGSRSVRKVAFRFTNHEGTTVKRVVKRSARQTSSGRFFMPLSGLGEMPPQSIVIQTSDPTTENARVFLCSNPKGESS